MVAHDDQRNENAPADHRIGWMCVGLLPKVNMNRKAIIAPLQ
jgi:hypothetical protein